MGEAVGGGGPETWLDAAKSCARRAVEFEGVGQLPVAVHYYAEAGRLLRALVGANSSDNNDILIRYHRQCCGSGSEIIFRIKFINVYVYRYFSDLALVIYRYIIFHDF